MIAPAPNTFRLCSVQKKSDYPAKDGPIDPRTFLAATAFAISFAAAGAAFAADPVDTGRFSDLAVGGFGPVAYFEERAPVKRSAEFETSHEGATWRFSSEANKAAFEAGPTAYAPQYGGYCVRAAAEGYTAKGNP